MSEIIQSTVDFLKVLADQTRLQIIDLLKTNEITQKDIEETLGIKQSTISQHLKILINLNLIEVEKKENKNFYKIKEYSLFRLLNNIRSFVIKLNKEKLADLEDLDVDEILF